MADEQAVAGDTGTDDTFDYEASAARIATMLGTATPSESYTDPAESPGMPEQTSSAAETPSSPSPSAQTYEVPKSWKKEMHAHWGKVTPEAQAYIIEREKQLLDGFSTFKPVQEALTPYMDWLQKLNVRPEHAIQSLFNAQWRLTQGPIEERRAALKQLQKQLGLEEPTGASEPQAPVNPELKSVQDKLSAIEQEFEAQRQRTYNTIYEENTKKLNAFAADTAAHPYFEEVADEMVIFLKQGLSLQDAYAKAIRTNEAVWAKEQARLLTEAEAKWKENARLASLPKRKAASVNIKSDRDGPEPTEPLGSIEDTIRKEHARILARS